MSYQENVNAKPLYSCTLAIVGSFLPWVKFDTIFGSISIAGTEVNDGKVTIVIALVTAVLIFTDRLRGARVIAWIGLGYTGAAYLYLSEQLKDNNYVHISVGIGMWCTGIGFLAGGCFLTQVIRERKDKLLHFLPPVVSQ